MLDEYQLKKRELIEDLASAHSKISISFDSWTSPA